MTIPNKPCPAAWFEGPSAHSETLPTGEFLPWRIILLGPPGVGEGTRAELLNQRLLACHLSTGEVFRRAELVPDRTVWEMVRERGECLNCARGFILDGSHEPWRRRFCWSSSWTKSFGPPSSLTNCPPARS